MRLQRKKDRGLWIFTASVDAKEILAAETRLVMDMIFSKSV